MDGIEITNTNAIFPKSARNYITKNELHPKKWGAFAFLGAVFGLQLDFSLSWGVKNRGLFSFLARFSTTN